MLITFAARPAYNVGQVLYYELNIDYIVETYCVNKEKPALKCNGKCFLMQQLTSNYDNALGEETKARMAVVDAFFPLYFQAVTSIGLNRNSQLIVKNDWEKNDFTNSINLSVLVPPPQV